MEELKLATEDPKRNERFHMFPWERLQNMAILSGSIGAFSGFYQGVKIASLRYLTENSHRLPTKVGGWYFYHKKKNYVMILDGAKQSVYQGTRIGFLVTSFFGLEAFIDRYVRNGTIDFMNTMGAAMVSGFTLGVYNGLTRNQVFKYVKQGAFVGLSLGLTQDLLIWTRGGRIWYLDEMGIKNPRFKQENSMV